MYAQTLNNNKTNLQILPETLLTIAKLQLQFYFRSRTILPPGGAVVAPTAPPGESTKFKNTNSLRQLKNETEKTYETPSPPPKKRTKKIVADNADSDEKMHQKKIQSNE